MKNDPAHVMTDAEIAKLEKLIAKEYKKAHKEVSAKLDDYLARFAYKDAKWQEWVASGKKTQDEYIAWAKSQVFVGKKWMELRDTLAQDYTNAAKIAQSIAKEHAPEVYAINHNYGTYEIEKGALVDTSYSLYSKESVEYMYKGKPKLYHTYGKAVAKEIKEGKQYAWDRRRITSVLTQAILQGESIPNITKRLEKVTVGDHKAAIRNARTMMTGVQNAGRIDAYERGKSLGIPVRKRWIATLDTRTRHWHRELDGEIVDTDKPFENEFGKIMFPGDPTAHASNVFNCRCTLIAALEGFEQDLSNPDLRPNDKLGEMTYEEWLAEKKSTSNPIDLPEQKAAAIKASYNAQYSGVPGSIQNPVHKYSAAEGQAIIDQFDYDELHKEYSDIWANKTVTPPDYVNMKKDVTNKKFYLDKQIQKAKANGDKVALAKYQKQMDDILDFEKKGKLWAKVNMPEKAKNKAVKAKTTKTVAKTTNTPKTSQTTPKAPKTTAPKKPKKMTQAEAKKIEAENLKKMEDLDNNNSYVNIWKDPVSPSDYADKKGSIAAKKKYFEDELDKAKANGWAAKEAKFEQLLKDLDDFVDKGEEFVALKEKYDEAAKIMNAKKKAAIDKKKQELEDLKKKTYHVGSKDVSIEDYLNDEDLYKWYIKNGLDPDSVKQAKLMQADARKYKRIEKAIAKAEGNSTGVGGAYSAARKKAAVWAKDKGADYRRVDAYYTKLAKKVHGSKSGFEHEGYYHYTWGSGPFNQPLAGFRGSWSPSDFVGPGKVNIDANGYGDKIRGLTKLIEKSKYDRDFWVQSGQNFETLEGFLGIPYGTIKNMSESELQQFVNVEKELPQFMSGAVNKGGGTYTPGNMLLNIYCPKGCEALYVMEDGHYNKVEHEMILQRGGTYRITRIYYGRDEINGGRKLIVDMELRLEKGYNKFQQ